ncbi:MAG: hypothetical protein ABW189_07235 [Rickettsiales bacterium]
MSSVMPPADAFAVALHTDNEHGIINVEGMSLDDDARMDALIARIAAVPELRYLNVNKCTDDATRLRRILKELPKDGTLTALCMINCPIDDEGVDAFAECTGGIEQLARL